MKYNLQNLPEKNVLSHGGGRQTTALSLKILNEELPSVDAVVFADTGAERRGTLKSRKPLMGCAEVRGVFYEASTRFFCNSGLLSL